MLKACSLQRLSELGNSRESEPLKAEAKEHIARIANPDIRYAMYEHYINGKSWDKIADMFGCGTADAVRKRCNRYIRQNLS